jgi:hypothetical protein
MIAFALSFPSDPNELTPSPPSRIYSNAILLKRSSMSTLLRIVASSNITLNALDSPYLAVLLGEHSIAELYFSIALIAF